MRILVTGSTARQVGSTRVRDYATIPGIVAYGLREAGFDVEWRAVAPGEQLRQKFDNALVFLGDPLAMSSAYLYGALWTLDQFRDAPWSIDDTHLQVSFLAYQRAWKVPEHRLWRPPQVPRQRPLWEPYARQIERGLHGLMTGQHEFLVPSWDWVPRERLYGFGAIPSEIPRRIYDPTPFATRFNTSTPRRDLRWVLAALFDQRPWVAGLGLHWPVEYIGSKKCGFTVLETEQEVCDRYAVSMGVLSWPHPKTSQSVIWRARIGQALDAGCVLAGDPKEYELLHPSFAHEPSFYETLSGREFQQVALEQRTAFEKRTWSRKKFISFFKGVFK